LHNLLGFHEGVERIGFWGIYFIDEKRLRTFVRQCDVIVHLAAMNRPYNHETLYQTHILLVQKSIDASDAEAVDPHVFLNSVVLLVRKKSERESFSIPNYYQIMDTLWEF
jgi:UDP-2-acetamido-2,6-beta-L-arabino-hexul-4-ose reductase